jgi:hypothetical protein
MSNFQQNVYNLLVSLLGSTRINTEVNVNKLFPEYPNKLHHYDIVIPSFKLIVECHGEQHRTITSFGKQDYCETERNFVLQKHRDKRKEEVALLNDWGYIIIWDKEFPRNELVALDYLKQKVLAVLRKESDVET